MSTTDDYGHPLSELGEEERAALQRRDERRQKSRDTRRLAIIEALQQVVTTQRSARQAVDLLRPLVDPVPPDARDSQEFQSLRFALADAQEIVERCERARTLISGTGSIS